MSKRKKRKCQHKSHYFYRTARDRQRRTNKLKEIGVEVLIIVFAVSISIWFHGWAESWKDRKEENSNDPGLSRSTTDLAEMKGDLADRIVTLERCALFEEQGRSGLNRDSLATYRWIFFGSTQISPRISRYEALKVAVRLDIDENKKLL